MTAQELIKNFAELIHGVSNSDLPEDQQRVLIAMLQEQRDRQLKALPWTGPGGRYDG